MDWPEIAGWSLATLSAWIAAWFIMVLSVTPPGPWRSEVVVWRRRRLMDVTEHALYEGIAQAVVGNRVVDISRAIQKYVEGNGFSVVREFVGHGVGRSMHEEPQIPNFVEGKSSPKLQGGHDFGD